MLNFFRRSRIKVVDTATAEVLLRRRGRPAEHGETTGNQRTPTYSSWANAKSQARLAPEFESFQNFLKYMGERPKGYQLARRDENKPHSPSNSFWKKRNIL